MTLTELFTSIADAIRNRIPSASEKIKAVDFPNEIDNACNASEVVGFNIGLYQGRDEGKQEEYDRFWDTVQNYGKETIYYQYRFFEYPEELFNPKYDFVFSAANSYSANATFRGIKAKDIQKNCDFTKMTAVGIYYTFYQSSSLVNARTLKVNENVKYNNSFIGCTNLEEVRFEGSIGQNGLSFANSAKLSPDSLRSILTALSKNSTYASGKTITFNTASRSIIEADTECSTQLALAVSAGWTIAYNS